MLIKTILTLTVILTFYLDALTLKNSYYINNNNIYLSNIVQNTKEDKLIYKIALNKHTKKVKTRDIIKLLKDYGYKDITAKSRYIHFIKKSPIDKSKIKKFLENYYKNNYINIKIQDIEVEPRSYMQSLPIEYKIQIRKKNYLSKKGILDIKTNNNKKIFFNYTITGTLLVYVS
jgi:flagella basal body P-ring formation protein FlgA